MGKKQANEQKNKELNQNHKMHMEIKTHTLANTYIP